MSRAKRFLSVLLVMTIILTGIGLSLIASASDGISGAYGYVIFSGNSYPAQPSFSVRLQNICTLSGLSNTVNGSVHSNYNIDASSGPIVTVGEAVGTVTGVNIQTKVPGAAYVPMPDFSVYKQQLKVDAIAAGQYYPGNFSTANKASVNLNSPLYIEGSANLTGISFSGKGCIYAGGKISITGTTTNYDSLSNICMYSGYTSASKSDAAIDFACSSKNFTGLLYAPNGSILISGSNYTFNGSIMGRVVDVSGSNKTFNFADVTWSFSIAYMHRIYFDANGGVGGRFQMMAVGLVFTPSMIPTVTKTGYTFTGWSPALPEAVPAENTTYTAQWTANQYTITFDANGGSGGTSASMTYGTALTAPVVTKPGYVFSGWSPAVPSTVSAENTTYTAQWTKTAVSITKLAEGFKVNIQGWAAGNKYQIWSYQSITSDLFSGGTASQWILSKSYTLGSGGTAEADGSISFTIADFVSPDSNYTIAVRITDASGNYLGEIRDSYTPEDVSEVKIAKVLVDGEYSSGSEIREIKAGAGMTFAVIGNNVPGTVITAKVVESGTVLTANSAVEFGWNISALTPGTYTVQFTASNGATTDTKNITLQLYSLDTGIQYGAISELGLTATEDNTLPKALTIDPDFTNGSFYYRVGEPGRKAIFTSGLFDPADSIEYTFTKYGIYQVSGFVNREYEVKIGSNFDDGYIKQFVVSRSQTEPSTATLTAGNIDLSNPIQKLTEIRFEADAQIGGIGATPLEYSFWRYDAKGYALVKDWSSDNTLDWTPARVGHYTIEVRAKGADAGSYEVAKSVKVTVTDGTDQIAQDVAITLNEAELNVNATARAPITVKANAASSNSEDLLYKFYVSDAAMGTSTLQTYSADSNCIWTPRKAGTYTISVLVKNNASYGAYDAMESFEITVN